MDDDQRSNPPGPPTLDPTLPTPLTHPPSGVSFAPIVHAYLDWLARLARPPVMRQELMPKATPMTHDRRLKTRPVANVLIS